MTSWQTYVKRGMMVDSIHCLLQALRRFESMSSIQISGAASIADLAVLAVELEQQAQAWRVSSSLALVARDAHITAQPGVCFTYRLMS